MPLFVEKLVDVFGELILVGSDVLIADTQLVKACDALAEACGAEGVQVIGSKFVLYKANKKDPKIVLVKDNGKKR